MSLISQPQADLYKRLIQETIRFIASGGLMRKWTTAAAAAAAKSNERPAMSRQVASGKGGATAYNVFLAALVHVVRTSKSLVALHLPAISWPWNVADANRFTTPVWDIVKAHPDVMALCSRVAKQRRRLRESAPPRRNWTS
ncbi:hypothetical protein EXIGLDRAFT_829886 [Exidia glandulosa HHB12029]|uniref:Uncharacterized protein n=1 Tax=Exidia glandulosa HHB12029 TaxID=1314781 RepID=A0A165P5S3_EXIGL|nr:hypothetical protein EXIGLDRAFT_829886 [Exidia glandulosa HHB12029]